MAKTLLHNHLYQFHHHLPVGWSSWSFGRTWLASPMFPFCPFFYPLSWATLHINVIHELPGQGSFEPLILIHKNLDEYSLPDLLGGTFTCRFYQLLSFCYMADNCYSSGMCHVHLSLNNYGGKQHRNLHTWCFILCGLPEGTGLWLCLHPCEINVPSSDSCYSIYSHRASFYKCPESSE